MLIPSYMLAHLLGQPLSERDIQQEREVREYLYPNTVRGGRSAALPPLVAISIDGRERLKQNHATHVRSAAGGGAIPRRKA